MGQAFITLNPSTLAPLEYSLRRGFVVPPSGLRGSHCGAAAFASLSCGRDRVSKMSHVRKNDPSSGQPTERIQ